MSWGNVRGHDRVVEALRLAASEGRWPHALLFVGPEGIGKHLFAERLAQALLCERSPAERLEPCGACPGCRQIVAGDHPDLLTVARPEERHELPIDAIRTLCHDLAMKPMHGTRRVAIVDDADDLSEEAANAFLKTLEEPPPGAMLILIGTAPELQIDTILSRCRVLRFEPLSEADLAAVLVEHGFAEDQAERLAGLGEGSVGRARGLADAELAAVRRELIDTIADPRGFDAPALARKLETFAKEAGKESSSQRKRASLLVGELARLFRCALWETAGLAAPSADEDDRRAAEAIAQRLEPEDVFVLADRCLEADYHIARKGHMGMIFEALMHDLARVIPTA